MLCYLLFAAIYTFGGLVVGMPQPTSVTKVVIETQTFVARQVTNSTAASITTDDPVSASIASLLSLLIPPSSLTAAIASAIPSLYLSDVEGPNVLVIVYGAEEGNNPWVYDLPAPIYNYVISEADIDATVLPQIISLQSIQMSTGLAALSSMASLSNRPFTTTITQLGRVIVTTAYPTPTPTPVRSGLNTGAKIGLGIGIPAFVLLLGAIAFVLFHVRRNRYRSRGVELYDPPVKFQAQGPTIPFPEHNEDDYNPAMERFVRDRTGYFGSHDEDPGGREFVGHPEELHSGYVVNTRGERKKILRPSPRNSYIQRKPVGSFSSRRVMSMEGVPTADGIQNILGAGGYMARANYNTIEDEGFADAVEMPAAPVHIQHPSSEGDEKIKDATTEVKGPERMEDSNAVEENEKIGDANDVEQPEKIEEANSAEKDEKQEASTDGQH